MNKNDKTKKRLLREAHDMFRDLHDAGIADLTTRREFDALCISQTHELSPSKIKKFDGALVLARAVFAKIINVSVAAITQWERGEWKPSGPAKLLNLVEAKGVDVVL